MPRALSSLYEAVLTGAHPADVSSTGPTDPKTVTVPDGAVAVFATAKTGAARIAFGGVTADATHGLILPAAAAPALLPVGLRRGISVCGDTAATAVQLLFLR